MDIFTSPVNSSFSQKLRMAIAALLLINGLSPATAQMGGCTMVCNSSITLEVPSGGTLEFLPEYMLEGNVSQFCPNGVFQAQVQFGNVFLPASGNFVFDASHIDKQFVGRIKDLNSGNACWGEVEVIAAPTLSTGGSPLPQIGRLAISPNPASQTVRLALTSEEGDLILRVTDMLGRVVMAKTHQNQSDLDVSGLKDGAYNVWASTSRGKVFSGKFLKQH